MTPAPPGSRTGNRVTARRWARLLRELGHEVRVSQRYRDRPCDVLVAIHARKSHASVARFRAEHPERAVVVALAGTDLYGDLRSDATTRRSLELASLLVLLQPLGVTELPRSVRPKARVIYQSATRPPGRFRPRRDLFDVCMLAHLRAVKDPFRAALAARRLPADSRIRVVHVGGALTAAMATRARRENMENPRYRWLGELPHWQALRILARSRLLVLTSQAEGGANVVSEALACGVPVVSSHIPGSVGILGGQYPGYFPVGDTGALARLLLRAETDTHFYEALRAHCAQRARLVHPAREREGWRMLLEELSSAARAAARD